MASDGAVAAAHYGKHAYGPAGLSWPDRSARTVQPSIRPRSIRLRTGVRREIARCSDAAMSSGGRRSLPARAAVKGIRARVAPGYNLGQPAEVMGPAFRMAGALLGIG